MLKQWVPPKALSALMVAASVTSAYSQNVAPSEAALKSTVNSVSAVALSGPGLTLNQAIQAALQYSPALRAAEQDVRASEGATIQAEARPNPELQSSMEDLRSQTRTTTIQLAQPIELGGKRAARISAARLAQAQSDVELSARRAQVRADVSEAYFASAIAQEHVRLAQASAELSARALDVASKRVQAGKVSPVEETRAKVANTTARLEWVQSQSEARTAQYRLNSLMGRAANSPLNITWQVATQAVSSDAPDHLAVQASQLASAPLLQQARLEVERRKALAELEQARRVPDLTVTLGAKRAQELGRNQAVIGLAVPLPLWDNNQGNVLQALRLQDKADADFAASQAQVAYQWEQLTERMQAIQAELQVMSQDVLPGAESAWQAAVTGFEMGKFSFLETLDAQRTLIQARTQYLRALGDLHRTQADMDRLLGIETDRASDATTPHSEQIFQ